MSRWLARGVQNFSLGLLIVAILVGIPYASIRYVGWPLPTSMPDRNTLYDWIEHPITPERSWAVLSIVGWILWAGMVYVLVDEILARLGRFRRLPRLRIAPLQGLAAGMVGATAVTAPVAASTAPAPTSPAVPDIDPSTAAPQQSRPVATTPVQAEPAYVVEHGDWLSAVAARFLANPDAYPSIEALNPELKARDPRFPHHIEPGWRIRLPADAHDHGIRLHAAGTFIPAPAADPKPTPSPAETPVPPSIPTDPAGGGAPEADPTAGTKPTSGPASPDVSPLPDDLDGDGGGHPDVIVGHTHGLMAGGGLLAAMLYATLMAERRRQRGLYAAGIELPRPRNGRAERELRAAQQPLDVVRLDAALRSLSQGLASRAVPPDIVGVRVVGGDVHVLLGEPDDDPPAPWLDEGPQWALPAYIEPPAIGGPPSILPALVSIGSRAGRHLLIDLERLGTLTIAGHQYFARDVLRHIACELACNTWSDDATVVLAGFGDEADAISEIGPKRVLVADSTSAAIGTVRTELARRAAAGTAGPALLLLVCGPDAVTRAALADLHDELTGTGRCGIAVVTTVPDGSPIGTASLTLTETGQMRVELPGLRLTTDAAHVPVDMLDPLADLFRVARLAPQPDPTATDLPPWTDAIDPDAGVDAVFGPAVAETDPAQTAPPAPSDRARTTPQSRAAARVDGHATPGSDTGVVERDQLDADLAAWHDPTSARPRVGILGPIDVRMPGVLNDSRYRLYSEMLVYLLTRPTRSADRASIENALWYGKPAGDTTVRKGMYKLRQWLGPRADGGEWIHGTNDAEAAYHLADGVLFDWHLLLHLHQRGQARGPAGITDLHAALELVRGVPLANRPDTGPYRRPYTWVGDSDIAPDRIIAVIAGIAHQVAQHHLASNDPTSAAWAIGQAWLADPDRGFDELWHDRMRAEHQAGHTIALQQLVHEYLEANDAEVPEDLPTAVYNRIRSMLPAA